jgi:hypothetical protein
MKIDKTKFKDVGGRPLTQSLFLEVNYTPNATYTLKDYDHEWEGHVYPSLKRLYLEFEDPTEYDFANTYLLGWQHWQRLVENKLTRKHIDEWREELEYKLKARAVKLMVQSAESGNYQAAKWLADRGWTTRAAGRPTKAEVDGERAAQAKIVQEYGADVHRLFAEQGK